MVDREKLFRVLEEEKVQVGWIDLLKEIYFADNILVECGGGRSYKFYVQRGLR